MLSVIIYAQILLLAVPYVAAALAALLIGGICCGFRPLAIRRFMRRLILGLGHVVVRAAIRPWIRVVVDSGMGNTVPEGAVCICNHRSASDAFLVSQIRTARPAAQAMKGWPMRLPVLGWCAKVGGYFSVADSSYEESLEFCRKLLIEEKTAIFVYPEGTRSGSREINQFHGTFFRIAKDLGVPIVPVAIAGNENIPDRKFRMHRGTVLMKQLPAISAETVRNTALYTLKNQVRKQLEAATAELDNRLDDHEF